MKTCPNGVDCVHDSGQNSLGLLNFQQWPLASGAWGPCNLRHHLLKKLLPITGSLFPLSLVSRFSYEGPFLSYLVLNYVYVCVYMYRYIYRCDKDMPLRQARFLRLLRHLGLD